MAKCLIVAEKPSIADAIAKAMAGGGARQFKAATPVHSWSGTFQGRRCNFTCTGVTGHVMDIDFPQAYRSWEDTNPRDLFDAPTQDKPAGGGKMKNHLIRFGSDIDILYLWLDCDREGENICFECINIIKRVNRRLRDQNIWRAKFSSLAPSELRKAFAKPGRPDKNQSDAVEARKVLDLKVGVAFTRFQTLFFKEKYGQLNERSLISYGPCQTPTLGFVVKRSDERDWFNSEKYWSISIECQKRGWRQKIKLNWQRGKVFDKDVVEKVFYNQLNTPKLKTIRCIKLKKELTKRKRPIGLNTVTFLQSCSRGLHIGPKDAMHIAERLYLSGFVSYPRTETSSYPKGFDIRGTISVQTRDNEWGSYARTLLANGYEKPRKGHDAGDHPPITPVSWAPPGRLSGNEKRIYEFIVRYFLATVSPDCEIDAISATFKLEDEIFYGSGQMVRTPGFLEVANWLKVDEFEFPSEIKEGSQIPIGSIRMIENKTEPPSFMTEADLIALMEKHGIGTDASIPQHIGNIVDREYCKVDQSTRCLRPTALGLLLGHGYHKIDPQLVIPDLRSYMERNMTAIAKGKMRMAPVVETVLDIFAAKFDYFVRKFDKMDAMFDHMYNNPATMSGGKVHSKCGICHRQMKLFSKRGPPKLWCSNCKLQYIMPKGFIHKSGKTCPLSNFEVVHLTKESRMDWNLQESYPISPFEFMYGPSNEYDPERPKLGKKGGGKKKKKKKGGG